MEASFVEGRGVGAVVGTAISAEAMVGVATEVADTRDTRADARAGRDWKG